MKPVGLIPSILLFPLGLKSQMEIEMSSDTYVTFSDRQTGPKRLFEIYSIVSYMIISTYDLRKNNFRVIANSVRQSN